MSPIANLRNTTLKRRGGNLPPLVTGLVVGALLAGSLVPLLGADVVVDASGTPDLFGAGDDSGVDGESPSGAVSPEGDGAATIEEGDSAVVGGEGDSSGSDAGPGTSSVDPSGNGGTTAPASGTASGSAPLTASDIGVSKERILVGALTLNCKGCAAFGVGLTPTSHTDIVRAFAKDINDRGGINGRTVEVATADYDPVEDGVNGGGSQRRACLELTQNRKVFAAVMGGTFNNSCIYNENKTPLITNTEPAALDPETFNQSGGRLWSMAPSSPRTLANFARQLVAQKLITKNTKYGVVAQEVDGNDKLVKRYLVDELTRLGVPPTQFSVMPGNVATFPAAASTEQASMRGKGIDHVVLALDQAVNTGLWIQEAERNRWEPQYYMSEFPSGANDFTGGQQPSSFEGAIAITHTSAMSPAQLRSTSAGKRCIDIWERFSGGAANEDDLGWIFDYCNSFRAFELAAKAAGPNLTRDGFVRSLSTVGSFELAGKEAGKGSFGGQYGFGAVKWSAVDFTNTVEWSNSCPRADNDGKCWVARRTGDRMQV